MSVQRPIKHSESVLKHTIFIKLNFFSCFSTNNDEFADFSSAFTQSMSLNSSSTNLCKFFPIV